MSATGSGGQIVISDATREALGGEIAADSLHDLGHYVLKGIPNPVRLFQVDVPESEVGFPLLRAERLAD